MVSEIKTSRTMYLSTYYSVALVGLGRECKVDGSPTEDIFL